MDIKFDFTKYQTIGDVNYPEKDIDNTKKFKDVKAFCSKNKVELTNSILKFIQESTENPEVGSTITISSLLFHEPIKTPTVEYSIDSYKLKFEISLIDKNELTLAFVS